MLLFLFLFVFSSLLHLTSSSNVCLRGTDTECLAAREPVETVPSSFSSTLPVSLDTNVSRNLWTTQLIGGCTCGNCVLTPEEFVSRWQQGAIGFNTIDCVKSCLSMSIAGASTYSELSSHETLMPLRYSLNAIGGSDTLQVLADLRRAMFASDKYSVVNGMPLIATVNSPEPNFYTGDDATIRKCLVFCADNQVN